MTDTDTTREAVERLAAAADLHGNVADQRSNRGRAEHHYATAATLRALLAAKERAEAELSAFKAAHDIGRPKEGFRELVWREAQAFYENEDAALRAVAAERDAARAEAAKMREAVVEIRRIASLPGFDAAEQRRAIWKRANEAALAQEPGHE